MATSATTTIHSAEAVASDIFIPLLHSRTSSLHAMLPPKTENGDESYSYRDLLNRISRSDHSQGPTLTPPGARGPPTDKIISCILKLPAALRDLILSSVDAKDLLSLRLASRSLHNLVHASELALCAAFSGRIVSTYNIHPEAIQLSNLAELVRAEKQHQAMLVTAEAMADRLSWSLKSRPHLSSAATLRGWQERTAAKLAHKITGTLFYFQFYLDFLRETVIKSEEVFSPLDDKEYAQLSNVLDFDQQEFLDQKMKWLQESAFIDITCVLRLFTGICQGRRIPLKHKPNAYPFASVRQILIYHGLPPFARMLTTDKTLWDQTTILREYSEKIAYWTMHGIKIPHTNPGCENTHSLIPEDQPQEIRFDQNRTSQARDFFVTNQDIWDRSARAHMLRKNGRLPERCSPVDWLIAHVQDSSDSPKDEIMVGHWDQPNRR